MRISFYHPEVTPTHVVWWGTREDGASVACFLTDMRSERLCIMQGVTHYRSPRLYPDPAVETKMPVTVTSDVFEECKAAIHGLGTPELTYSYYHYGHALAEVETGSDETPKGEANCLSVVVRGKTKSQLDKRISQVRSALAKLNEEVFIQRHAHRASSAAKFMHKVGLPMYGTFEVDEYRKPPTPLTHADVEIQAAASWITHLPDAPFIPWSTLSFDFETAAALGGTSFTNDGADKVVAFTSVYEHTGFVRDGMEYHVYMDGLREELGSGITPPKPVEDLAACEEYLARAQAELPNSVVVTTGVDASVIVVHVGWNDYKAFWKAVAYAFVLFRPSCRTGWNIADYDDALMLRGMYASERSRAVFECHPEVPGEYPSMKKVSRQPPAMFHEMSRWRSPVKLEGGMFRKIFAKRYGERTVYVVRIPGIMVLDGLIFEGMVSKPNTPLSLKATTKRRFKEDLTMQKGDLSYAELSDTIMAAIFADCVGPHDPQARAIDHPGMREAIRHLMPHPSLRAEADWWEVMGDASIADVQRVMDIKPLDVAAYLQRFVDYSVQDARIVLYVINDANYQATAVNFGLIQHQPLDILIPAGQVSRAYHGIWKTAEAEGFQLEGNYRKKDASYGGGRVFSVDQRGIPELELPFGLDYWDDHLETTPDEEPAVLAEGFNESLQELIKTTAGLVPPSLLVEAAAGQPQGLGGSSGAPSDEVDTERAAPLPEELRERVREAFERAQKGDRRVDLEELSQNLALEFGDLIVRDGKLTEDYVVVVLDYSSLYPSVILESNPGIDTIIPDWLAAETRLTYETFESYTPINKKYTLDGRDGNYKLPFTLLVNPDKLDSFEVQTAEGTLFVLQKPVVRITTDIPDLRTLRGAELSQFYAHCVAQSPELNDIQAEPGRQALQVAEIRGKNGGVSMVFHMARGSRGWRPMIGWAIKSASTRRITRCVRTMGGTRHDVHVITADEFPSLGSIMLKTLLDKRAAAKKEMNKYPKGSEMHVKWDIYQQVLKIAANSYYGASGGDGELYHPHVPELITTLGRHMLGEEFMLARELRELALLYRSLVLGVSLNELRKTCPIYRVVYGDTDSCMILLPKRSDEGWYHDCAEYFTQRLRELGYRIHAVTCDSITQKNRIQSGKKKYVGVANEDYLDFLALNPTSPDADIKAIRKLLKSETKGFSWKKSDQTAYGGDYVAHIAAAIIAQASAEQLDAIEAHYRRNIVAQPVENLLKWSNANLDRGGSGNTAARRADYAGHQVIPNSRFGWAQYKAKDGSTYFGSPFTDAAEDLDLDWVIRMTRKEVTILRRIHANRQQF